jgi:hypothetical protein
MNRIEILDHLGTYLTFQSRASWRRVLSKVVDVKLRPEKIRSDFKTGFVGALCDQKTELDRGTNTYEKAKVDRK